MTLKHSQQIFEKYSSTKLCENPPCGSRIVPCGDTEKNMKVVVAFRNFVKMPKTRN